jgi:hypothetical protein
MQKLASEIQIGEVINPIRLFSDFRVSEIRNYEDGFITFFGKSINSDRDVFKVKQNRMIEVLDRKSTIEQIETIKSKVV